MSGLTISEIFHFKIHSNDFPNASEFHNQLWDLMQELEFEKETWDNQRWAVLASWATQDVLNSIDAKKTEVAKLFDLLDLDEHPPATKIELIEKLIRFDPILASMPYQEAYGLALSRLPKQFHYFTRSEPKTETRVQEKLEMANRKEMPYFKVVNDFLAFCIPLDDLNHLPSAIEQIRSVAEDNGGTVYIEGDENQSQCSDISKLIYVYLPKYGLIEFQVAHPLARYTLDRIAEFRLYPELRENKPDFLETGFYELAKKYLLDEANGCFQIDEDARLIRRHEIIKKAYAIHMKPNGDMMEIDEELKVLIEDICQESV